MTADNLRQRYGADIHLTAVALASGGRRTVCLPLGIPSV